MIKKLLAMKLNFNWLYRTWETLKLIYNTFLLKISKGKITYQETRELLKNYAYVANIRILDNYFTLANKHTMKKLIKLSPVIYRFIIPNFAVGIIWSRTHAYNFFIDSDKKVWGIEPQTNKVFEITDKKEDIQLMIIQNGKYRL